MTKQQKIKIAKSFIKEGLIITSKQLSQLDYERKNDRSEERFILRRIPLC